MKISFLTAVTIILIFIFGYDHGAAASDPEHLYILRVTSDLTPKYLHLRGRFALTLSIYGASKQHEVNDKNKYEVIADYEVTNKIAALREASNALDSIAKFPTTLWKNDQQGSHSCYLVKPKDLKEFKAIIEDAIH